MCPRPSSAARGPDSASKDDLLGSEQRLRQHFDAVGAARHDVEDRISQLPPCPCALLLAAGDDRARIWTMVAQFTDETVVPEDLAREWAVSLPVALDDLPVMGRLVVAELLLAYRQPTAAAEQFQTAVK